MIAMTDVLVSSETATVMKDLALTSLGKSFVSVVTDKGPLDIQFEGFASDFMVVGKTRDGLNAVILLAADEARGNRSTIILSQEKDS